MDEHLLIFGASARAAAFSALRANLRPWCADLFGDTDLQARCPTVTLPPWDYPNGFVRLAVQAPPGPWIYTGALENRRALVRQLARLRPLWGNDAPVLGTARSPQAVHGLLLANAVPCPKIHLRAADVPPHGRWLVKPRQGAGGKGIRWWRSQPFPHRSHRSVYFQEYIDGDAWAAIYLADRSAARLLGVTRQLVGESWLHAAPFHYCGSIGPLALAPFLYEAFERLGTILTRGCRLSGLFGVDGVLRDGVPWPLEVNPRYTASVEVLEYATGVSALALHRRVYDRTGPEPAPASTAGPSSTVGKAILFAKAPLIFPNDGPWLPTARWPGPIHELPAFADIPPAGQRIRAGRPILTLFARADSAAACLDSLQESAADLDHWLFER